MLNLVCGCFPMNVYLMFLFPFFEHQQGVDVTRIVQELLPVLPGISVTILPEVVSRLSSRIAARIIRDVLL